MTIELYQRDKELHEIIHKIPYITFPADWQVKIIPPFANAVVRFMVKKIDTDKEISVYLDNKSALGYMVDGDGNNIPYWEIYPYEDNIKRFFMNDTEELIESIKEELNRSEL